MSIGGRTAAATVFVDVEGDLTKFRKDLDGAAKETSSSFNRATKVAGGAMVGVAAGIAVASAKTFVDFQKGITEVYTLLPDASEALRKQLSEDAKTISTAFGQELGTVTTAMYDSISAGVPADQVLGFLQQAGQLAIGGATDIGTAVDGLTGVINAYGAENITAAQASDILFGTVKAGKTTVDELAGKISAVTPIAAELGLGFDQVGASFAAVTAVTGNTAEASTQLRSVLAELSKDGAKAFTEFGEATGQTFKEFVAGGGTLAEALQLLEGRAGESGKSLGDMFGSVEAGGAALIIAKDGAAKFNDSLDALRDGAGSTGAAYLEMKDTLAVTLDRVKASLSVAALNIGETIAPALTGLATGLETFADFLSHLPGPIAVMAVGALGLGGALLFLAGPILKVIQLIRIMNLAVLFNPYVLAAIALVAFAYIVYENWDSITRAVYVAGQAIYGFLDQYITQPVAAIADAFRTLPGHVSAAWDGITLATGTAVEFLKRKLGELLEFADRALGPLDEIIGFQAKLGGKAFGAIGGLLGFDDGGIIPGRTGAPRLVLAHGGETVLPTHKDPNAGVGGSDTYNISVSVAGGSGDMERQGTELVRVMQRELDRTKRGAGRTDLGRVNR